MVARLILSSPVYCSGKRQTPACERCLHCDARPLGDPCKAPSALARAGPWWPRPLPVCFIFVHCVFMTRRFDCDPFGRPRGSWQGGELSSSPAPPCRDCRGHLFLKGVPAQAARRHSGDRLPRARRSRLQGDCPSSEISKQDGIAPLPASSSSGKSGDLVSFRDLGNCGAAAAGCRLNFRPRRTAPQHDGNSVITRNVFLTASV